MANRDLTNINRVVETTGGNANVGLASAFNPIFNYEIQALQKQEEAKSLELYSNLQLDLNTLDNQIKKDYEADPKAGKAKYEEEFNNITKKYSSLVSPSLRQKWNENILGLKTSNFVKMQNWEVQQAEKNTKTFMSNALSNIYSSAMADGLRYGEEGGDIDVLLNYQSSIAPLAKMGNENLGEATTTQALKGVSDSYIKSFLSGVSDTNPMKALELIDNEEVGGLIQDPEERLKMKNAIENKTLQFEKVRQKNELINLFKTNKGLYDKSVNGTVSYAELEQTFASNPNISEATKNYLLKKNGYKIEKDTPEKPIKMTGEEKLKFKEDLLNKIILFGNTQDLDEQRAMQAFGDLQEKVYEGLSAKALTEKEANFYFNNLLEPRAANLEGKVDLSTGGYGYAMKSAEDLFTEKFRKNESELVFGQEVANPALKKQNLQNKVDFYNFYLEELDSVAKINNISIEDLSTLDNITSERLVNNALKKTEQRMLKKIYPELKDFEQMPNAIKTEQAIQFINFAPNRLSANSITANFKLYKKDNKLYRKYDDGTIQVLK